MVQNYIARLPEFLNENEKLVRRGRYLETTFLLKSGSQCYYIRLHKGKIETMVNGQRLLKPWSFSITASDEAWLRHWMVSPPPGWHDIFAMAKIGEASIEGDLYPMMSNLRYFKELMALPRGMGAQSDAG